jgi:hypothetical protein
MFLFAGVFLLGALCCVYGTSAAEQNAPTNRASMNAARARPPSSCLKSMHAQVHVGEFGESETRRWQLIMPRNHWYHPISSPLLKHMHPCLLYHCCAPTADPTFVIKIQKVSRQRQSKICTCSPISKQLPCPRMRLFKHALLFSFMHCRI